MFVCGEHGTNRTDRAKTASHCYQMGLKCGEVKVPNAEGSGEGSTSRNRGAIAPGPRAYRRAGGWLPVYAAWTDDRPAGAVLAVDDVDPVRLQCKMCVSKLPGGIVRYHDLRFINPEGLEWYLDHAERCARADRHHRCTCCLEWIYGCAARVCAYHCTFTKRSSCVRRSASRPSTCCLMPRPPANSHTNAPDAECGRLQPQ